MSSETDETLRKTRLETEALVVAYAMSRLGDVYLALRGVRTWKAAFEDAGNALEIKETSVKNLRQEFDPVFTGRGWNNRPMRSSRQRVLDEMEAVSDAALSELIERVLCRDTNAVTEAIDALAPVTGKTANVAERLLTGRRAEEYFLQHCLRLVNLEPDSLTDQRMAACGYDFGVQGNPERAIEVKGLKPLRGVIQFTDLEWSEASRRRNDYSLVLVGNLATNDPIARVFLDPFTTINATSTIETSIRAVWRSTVAVQ